MTPASRPTSVGLASWLGLREASLLLACAPAGGLLVGTVDLVTSSGFADPGMALAFALVAVFYAAQLAVTLARPAWTDTWWAPVILTTSALSSPLFTTFLVDPRPPIVWFWLLEPVVVLAAYLCRPAHAALVTVGCLGCGWIFLALSEIDVAGHTHAVAAGAAAIVLPGVVAALVLGRVRRRERSVLEQTRLDPVTGVLNRRGLEHELSEWSERGRGAEPVCLVSIYLDSFDEAASAWGGAAADQVMARVAVALERAYHRSHLVSRFVDHEFIVVSDIDPDLLVPSLLRAVRVASPQRPVTASAGVVSGIPLDLLAEGQLVPMVERARQRVTAAQLSAAGVDAQEFEPGTYVPVPVPQPVPAAPPREEEVEAPDLPGSDARVLGWWLAGTGVLLSAVPRRPEQSTPVDVAVYAACLVLACAGMWVAQSESGHPRVGRALVALTLPVTVLVVMNVPTVEARYLVVVLAAYPATIAGVLLDRVWAQWMVVLLPVSFVLATAIGPTALPHALSVTILGVGLVAVTALLAAMVRRRRLTSLNRLHVLTLTDPTTGVLTRAGLAREFLDLPPARRTGILLVSVLPRGAEGQGTALEADLAVVATSLHELARGRGVVGRVSGRDLVLVVPGADRLALLRRRLQQDLGERSAEVQTLVGLAYTDDHSEGGLWQAVNEADDAVRRQTNGDQGPSHLVPVDATP